VDAYVNFLDRDDQDRVRAAYGEDAYRRLARIKSVYDPDNVFCPNHNITPSRAKPSQARHPIRAQAC
jgi:hypothetical protein